jgi:hypothetical protein
MCLERQEERGIAPLLIRLEDIRRNHPKASGKGQPGAAAAAMVLASACFIHKVGLGGALDSETAVRGLANLLPGASSLGNFMGLGVEQRLVWLEKELARAARVFIVLRGWPRGSSAAAPWTTAGAPLPAQRTDARSPSVTSGRSSKSTRAGLALDTPRRGLHRSMRWQ